ncbi:alpha/beta hydrolase [Agromyces aerolatus]|uniref:alpha/beta hydrolase n=1 Tax=Agromyces sp. LY-1074 TaxID=3074080 RepID=UPI0028672D6D|nr:MULTISPECIES: alpha/beta hydrolase [unclassified Agromyces]MDR5698629.1 alpha/beta hydrolase [Agromyces sp. LY-1074]MDR5704923.1 alpha/beta hydrolase [Agromyces sp. LY-1358]
MSRSLHSGGSGPWRRRRGLLAAAAVAAALAITGALSAFHPALREIDPGAAKAASEVVPGEIIGIRTFTPPAGLLVDADLEYGTREDGTLLTLDVCRPSSASVGANLRGALPAVVSVHGGSWARGDKANADWRNVCLWLASEGFVAASVNYRLVPDATFPAQLDDVSLAVEWVRDAAQIDRFGIDPGRIGVFGGSAGGNLAALIGAVGDGPTDRGARVAAVAELSGPVALDALAGSSTWLQAISAAYLGCEASVIVTGDCELAPDASAATHLDASDPPVFIGHAQDEVIPLAQSLGYAAALRAAGVPVELAVVPGGDHSIGILDEAMRARVATFLHTYLA